MENVRVIKLNPNTYISNVITFDEAFDEYSDASGKRIKKRAEKQRAKAELQQAKGEKKVARVGKRTARKVAKSEGRDTTASMRQARRRQRIEEAQARKTGRAEAIQSRRTGRKTSRLERRALGEELEPEIDETIQDTEDNINDSVEETNEERGMNPNGYEQDGGGEYAPESDELLTEPDYNEDDKEVNESNDDEEYGKEYDSYQNDEEDTYGSGFDGSVTNDDEFSDLEQASQVINIPDAITVIADKIEWNKELYSRLDGKKKEIITNNASANIDMLDSQMKDRGNRIGDLEELLDGWADCKYNYDGNNQFEQFPNEDIDYSNADGKNKFAKMKRKRYNVVSKARENAKKKREKVTLVKTTLNPIFENGRIVVPSSSNFMGIPQGTGLNGLDNSNDYDAPPVVDIDLTSNADGTSKININGIILGVGIAIVGIWAIRKYKLIK